MDVRMQPQPRGHEVPRPEHAGGNEKGQRVRRRPQDGPPPAVAAGSYQAEASVPMPPAQLLTYGAAGQLVVSGAPTDPLRGQALQLIRDYLRRVLEQQGIEWQEVAPEEAETQVAEGGYWSAEETAGRILDFAKAISNGDPKLYETVRDAFLKGFDEAEAAFGTKLPEVSYKTKELVLKGLDEIFGRTPAEDPPEPAQT